MQSIRKYLPYLFSVPILLITIFGYYIFLKPMGSDYTYVFLPLFWLVLGAAAFFFVRGKHYSGKKSKDVRFWICLAAALYLIIRMMSGIIDGFGYSPYDTSFTGVLRNGFAFGLPLVGKEFVRAAMLSGVRPGKKGTKLVCVITCVVLALSDINVYRAMNNLKTPFGVMEQLGGYLMPALACSALLTLGCIHAGYIPGIIYRLSTVLPFYLLPVMPDSTWLTVALLGTLLPFCVYILVGYDVALANHKISRRDMKKEKPSAWIGTFALLLAFVLFISGALPYYPVAVATGSMEPTIMTGDMVVVDKTEDAYLMQVGDVIQYQRGSFTVIHRIIERNEEGGTVTYITKGDNNDAADSGAVTPTQIVGKVIFRVPYVGWLTLWMHSQQVDNTEVDVETGK